MGGNNFNNKRLLFLKFSLVIAACILCLLVSQPGSSVSGRTIDKRDAKDENLPAGGEQRTSLNSAPNNNNNNNNSDIEGEDNSNSRSAIDNPEELPSPAPSSGTERSDLPQGELTTVAPIQDDGGAAEGSRNAKLQDDGDSPKPEVGDGRAAVPDVAAAPSEVAEAAEAAVESDEISRPDVEAESRDSLSESLDDSGQETTIRPEGSKSANLNDDSRSGAAAAAASSSSLDDEGDSRSTDLGGDNADTAEGPLVFNDDQDPESRSSSLENLDEDGVSRSDSPPTDSREAPIEGDSRSGLDMDSIENDREASRSDEIKDVGGSRADGDEAGIKRERPQKRSKRPKAVPRPYFPKAPKSNVSISSTTTTTTTVAPVISKQITTDPKPTKPATTATPTTLPVITSVKPTIVIKSQPIVSPTKPPFAVINKAPKNRILKPVIPPPPLPVFMTTKRPACPAAKPAECQCNYKEMKDSDKLLAVVITKKGGFKGRRINSKAFASLMNPKIVTTSGSNATSEVAENFVFPAGHYYFPQPVRFAQMRI